MAPQKDPVTRSNAPRHWPEVKLVQFDNLGINYMMVGGALSSLHAPPATSLAFMRTFLYEDGILEVPIVITENGKSTGVFVYSTGDKDAAAHYSGARAILRTRENAGAVYYGPDAIMPVAPAKVLKPIDTPMFSKVEHERADARYALWWPTEEDPSFTSSPDRPLLDRWFEALDGYGYVLFSAFVNDLELVERQEEEQVYLLPDRAVMHQLEGPGETSVMLHASAAKGVFLVFDRATVSVKTRRLMLRLLADFATHHRSAIETHNVPRRPEERGLEAWRRIRDEALDGEASGNSGAVIHEMTALPPGQAAAPAPAAAAVAATRPGMPSQDVLAFAADLIDGVVARLQQKPVARSSAEQLGGPNVFPVIAARVGGRVWEREVAYEDTQLAVSAAGRVLDEWPGLDMAGVLVDAALRENGQRVDILSVTAQAAGEDSATNVFQRYTSGDDGRIKLVGRLTAMQEQAFILPPSAEPPGASGVADEQLMALVTEAMTTITQTMVAIDATSDVNDQVMMPSALLGLGEERPTIVRFAMQGPLTAADSCFRVVQKEGPKAQWVAFWFDDLMRLDGQPDRRLRFCVHRRGDPATAIVDQRFETPAAGRPFTMKGGPEFRRWAGPMIV